MANERPNRQRRERSATEFFRASLLHKEEVELRKALHASLKEARTDSKRKQPNQSGSIILNAEAPKKAQGNYFESYSTKSVSTGTDTRFRLKSSAKKKFEITSKQYGDSLAKSNAERKGKGFCERTGQLLITSMKRKGNGDTTSCFVKRKKTNHEKWNNQAAASQKSSKKVSTSLAKKIDSAIISTKQNNRGCTNNTLKKETGKSMTKKDLQSPLNTLRASRSLWEQELTILPKSKLTLKKSQNISKVNCSHKGKVVRSLIAKFGANASDERDLPARQTRGDDVREVQTDIGCTKMWSRTDLQKNEFGKLKQDCSPLENPSSIYSADMKHVSSSHSLQGKAKKRLKHKFKDRKLVNPLGEIYIPANVAKTEDFLTFLCLRGSSGLPKSFDIFSNPDPFVTQPADQSFDDGTASFQAFPVQSSVTYSPPSSRAPTPSDSSVASPVSSNDGWIVNDA